MVSILYPLQIWASPATLVLHDAISERVSLIDSLEFYEPGLQQPDIDEIIQLSDQQWRSVRLMPISLAFQPRHTLWFRLRIQNQTHTIQELALNNINPATDLQTVYIQEQDGSAYSPHSPENSRGSHASFIDLQPQSIVSIFVKNTGFHGSFVSLSLLNADYYRKQQHHSQIVAGLIDGMILGLMLYNLLLGVKTRQSMYYIYSLLGFFNLATMIIYQNFFPSLTNLFSNEWRTNLSLFIPLLGSACLVQFIRIFLSVARHHSRIDHLMRMNIAITLVINVSFLLGAPMVITTPVFIIVSLVTTAAIFYMCIIDREHQRSSRIMVFIGVCMPVAYGVMTVLAALGEQNTGHGYMIFMQSLVVVEMLMFSLAMANRIRDMQNRHEQELTKVSEARIVNEAHNRLLAHLNHEMRTPLNGILGAAEILLQKSRSINEPVFSMIYQTALPLKQLVDDMVNIRSITDNPNNIEHVSFELTALLQECMDIFLPVAHKKHIRLYITISDSTPRTVSGDPNRLRQILLNLIGNACKFTSEGEIGLHVRKQEQPGVNRTQPVSELFFFEVCDSGVGISPTDEARLFQSYETGITDTNPTGTGLGLSIVRELSQRMGGHCGYQNLYRKDGKQGSKFWFSAMLEVRSEPQAFQEQTGLAAKSVLLADENDAVCEHLTQLIARQVKSVKATSTEQALCVAISSGMYDVVVIHQPMLSEKVVAALSCAHTSYCTYIDQSESLYLGLNDDAIVRRTSSDSLLADITRHCFPAAQPSSGAQPENQPLNDLNILVAEDIPINQQIICELLDSISSNMTICNNGLEALQAFVAAQENGKPFDVVIMDCEMPVQDGFETTQKIRQYEQEHQLSRIRIIALTAHTELAYRQRSIEAGMDVFLTKPVRRNSLRECLVAGKILP